MKATERNKSWCQANAQFSILPRSKYPQLPKLMAMGSHL